MKTIRIFLVIAALLQISVLEAQVPATQRPVGTMQAQRMQRTKEGRATLETEQMKTKLSLTDSQAVNYEKIILKYAAIQEELYKQLNEMQIAKNEELKRILTPEQLEQLNHPSSGNLNRKKEATETDNAAQSKEKSN
jgi:hypothetical protein